jgi:hypothetical protein
MQGFGLRSASGESGAEGGEKRLAHRSRSATPAAEPQTEARRHCGILRMPARDERGFCEAEQARSRGKRGDRQACEAKQKLRWSRRNNSFNVQKPGIFLILLRHSVELLLAFLIVTKTVRSL